MMNTKLDDNEVKNVFFASTLLMSELNSLSNNYYICTNCSIEKSKVLDGNRYLYKFKSEQAKRIISISYSPPAIKTKIHRFDVNIKPFNGDRVYLDDLFNIHNLFHNADYFDLETYEGDTKQKIQKFVKFLDKVFSENFPDIISGKKWEDIGFDWQGYK